MNLRSQLAALVADPACWHARNLADERWIVPIAPREAEEIDDAVRAIARDQAPPRLIDRAHYPLDRLARRLDDASHALRDGLGFVLLRGMPVERWSLRDAEHAFLLVGAHLGTPLSQNTAGELIVHICDKGPLRSSYERGYATANEAKFHIDLTDVVGLLCIRQAVSGGRSRLASALAVLAAVMREQPDLLPILERGFPWDRRDEQGAGEPAIGPPIPVFSASRERWTCRYNRGFIEAAFRRQGIELADEQRRALDFVDAAAARPEHVLEMDFRPGDVQLVSNATILHARTAFADAPDPAHKRMLLRAWLDLEAFRPYADDATLRDALVRYGNLGRPAADPRARLPA